MLISDHPSAWIDSGAAYLEFVAAVGWLVCAILAAAFWAPRAPALPNRRRSLDSLGAALGFTLLALASVAAVLERHGREPPGIASWVLASTVFTATGATILLGIVPWPAVITGHRSRFRRLIVPGIGAIPLALAFAHPLAFAWSAFAIYGGLGTWLCFGRIPAQSPAEGRASPRKVARLLGCAVTTLGLGAVVTTTMTASPLPSGLRAVVIASGASYTAAALWRLYLAERTLPGVCRRPVWPGLQRRDFLPEMVAAVLVVGFLLLRVTSGRAETFMVRQLTEELHTVVEALAADDATFAVTGDDDDGGSILQRLLETSPNYRAAALWEPQNDTFVMCASTTDTGTMDQRAATAMLPRPGRETATVLAGTAFVRWHLPVYPGDTLLVVAPTPFAHRTAARFLSVEVEAHGLAEIIIAQRLQTLAIVGLAALITAISVLGTTRAFNETELHALKLRSELENEARNQLLAMVSHEVRTPLQSVLGYADLAAADALPPAAARHVRAIRHQGAALLRIVQDILDLSALRSGRLQLQLEPVALADLVAELRQAVAERARRKGLAFSIAVDPVAPAAVVADRVRLAQVLLNLIGNAIKFTAVGSVRVVIRRAERMAPAGRVAMEFRVEDTGPGIAPAQLRRIFEPFRKGHDHSTLDAGVGLGLAICEQIVTTLQGRIGVESVVGQGSTFRVELTFATTTAGAAATHAIARRQDAAALPESESLTGLRLLIVDDHPYVRDLMRDFLQGVGATIAASKDGASAQATAASFHPDVILLDLRLPDCPIATVLDGLRAAAPSAVDPWIVGMSAGATDADIQAALDRGMNDFLIKPVSLPGLVETLRLSPAGSRIQRPLDGRGASGPVNPRTPTPAERTTLLAEVVPAIVRIAHACHVGDAPHAVAEAHYLANSCTVLDLPVARDICRAIESAAASEDLTTARALLDDLRGVIAVASPGALPGS